MSTMVATQPEAMPKTEVTPEELLRMPEGKHFELIDGRLRERNSNVLASLVASSLGAYLRDACHEKKLGWLLAATCGYRCFPWKPNQVRRSSITFIRADRLSEERLSEGFCSIPPDLAVEVVSPNDLVGDLDEKVQEYLRAGVKLIWVVRPKVRTVQVFRADGSERWLREHDEISGEDVMPGFRCQVGSLFPSVAQTNPDEPTKSAAVSETPHS